MEYTLDYYAACGMHIPILKADREDTRAKAASWLRSLRRDGFPIATLEKGREWEVREPADCAMIPDECGILRLKKIPVRMHTCRACDEEFPEGDTHECWTPDEEEGDEE
jgi:hypothetical protein